MKTNIKNNQGSTTIEVALIMPIVIFVIIGLIYMGMYLYNKALMGGMVNNALLEGKIMVNYQFDHDTKTIDYENINHRGIYWRFVTNLYPEENKIKQMLLINSQLKLFSINHTKIECNGNVDKIKIMTKIYFSTPFNQVNKLLTKQSQVEIVNQNNMNAMLESEVIRNIDLIISNVGEVKGLEETYHKLKDLVSITKEGI